MIQKVHVSPPSLGAPPVAAPATKTPAIDAGRDLYGSGLLFQGPLFQRIRRVLLLNSNRVELETDVWPASRLAGKYFGPASRQSFVYDDPGVVDCLLQAIQLTIPQSICLPISIGRIDRLAPVEPGLKRVVGELLRREEDTYVARVTLTEPDGRPLLRLEDYRMKILQHAASHPSAEELAAHGWPNSPPVQVVVPYHSGEHLSAPWLGFVEALGEARQRAVAPIWEAIKSDRSPLLTRRVGLELFAPLAEGESLRVGLTLLEETPAGFGVGFDFTSPHGELLARGELEAACAGGATLSEYVRKFLRGLSPGRGPRRVEGSSASPANAAAGAPLVEQTIATAQRHASEFQNIYFRHFFVWQQELLDLVVREQQLPAATASGELATGAAEMQFVREARPGDKLRCVLRLIAAEENQAELACSFWRGDELIAAGAQHIQWRGPTADSPHASWPEAWRRVWRQGSMC